MESIEEIMLETEEKMNKSVAFYHEQLSGIRTGKASPSLVENITVDYYGAPTRIRELGSISSPEPRLLVINAYDPSILGEIEKCIQAANLGVTPMNDGKVIRIPIPELSEERRGDLVKVAKRYAEETRVAVRNLRREANEHAKTLQKNSSITEDDRDQTLDSVQKLTDTHTSKVDSMLTAKESEISEI